MVALDELRPGRSAYILSIGGAGALRHHLLDRFCCYLTSLCPVSFLCISLLPGQAVAADAPESALPTQTETSETGHPNAPNELIMPALEEYPEAIGAVPSED